MIKKTQKSGDLFRLAFQIRHRNYEIEIVLYLWRVRKKNIFGISDEFVCFVPLTLDMRVISKIGAHSFPE